MQSVTSNAVASAVPNIISSTLSQIFLNCKMNVEFVNNTEFGGNGFLFHLYDPRDWEYTQVMIAPISNDYSIWYPPTYIFIRVRDYATGNWQGWRQI
jgi:hypothetical protein